MTTVTKPVRFSSLQVVTQYVSADFITVRVDIGDVNDNPPSFNYDIYTLDVPEDVELNQTIEPYITAEDPDECKSF